MKVPGNLWLEVWSTAQPIPARRQRRLFDDTKESEKVKLIITYSSPLFTAFKLKKKQIIGFLTV